PVLIVVIAQLLVYSVSNSLIVIAAFDAKVGRPERLPVYIQRALTNVVTVLVLSIAVLLIMALPFVVLFALVFLLASAGSGGAVVILMVVFGIAFVIYALYVWAGFTPLVPAIVIEGAGYGALGRAWALTRDYRWRIFGVTFVLGIVIGLVEFAGG